MWQLKKLLIADKKRNNQIAVDIVAGQGVEPYLRDYASVFSCFQECRTISSPFFKEVRRIVSTDFFAKAKIFPRYCLVLSPSGFTDIARIHAQLLCEWPILSLTCSRTLPRAKRSLYLLLPEKETLKAKKYVLNCLYKLIEDVAFFNYGQNFISQYR